MVSFLVSGNIIIPNAKFWWQVFYETISFPAFTVAILWLQLRQYYGSTDKG
jgi:hypothetical protein